MHFSYIASNELLCNVFTLCFNTAMASVNAIVAITTRVFTIAKVLVQVKCNTGFVLFCFVFIFEDKSPFCGSTATPVLDFWWRPTWVPKPE